VIRYIVRRHERFVFNRLAIIPVFAVLFLAARDGGQFVALSIAAFDDPVFFHGRFHASVAPLDSRFKIPDATMEELSFRTRTDRAPCTNILELPDYVCRAGCVSPCHVTRFAIRDYAILIPSNSTTREFHAQRASEFPRKAQKALLPPPPPRLLSPESRITSSINELARRLAHGQSLLTRLALVLPGAK